MTGMRIWSAALLTLCAVPSSSLAQIASAAAVVKGADAWVIYGTTSALRRDASVVGSGSIVAAPLATPADPWTSGAVAAIPQALKPGEPVTVAFWVKAAANESVTLTFQQRDAPYTTFLAERIALTPNWQLVVKTAAPPTALTAGTQVATVQFGQAQRAVTLGPVLVLDGAADATRIKAAFAAFHPDRLAEAVSIASDPGVTLAGTLRTPVGRGAGPFPLAIVIQGHGRNGRGGFDVLMNRLLADGIATLEYDKRGIASSTGTYGEDIDKLTRDAQAAVAAMRRRADIDGGRIALLGHSQGGAIAPTLAAADSRIAAIVTFAGPVGDGYDLFGRSMREQLLAAGKAEAAVAPLVEATLALIKARVEKAGPDAVAPLKTAVIDGLVANGFTREQAAAALAGLDNEDTYQVARARIASDLRSLRIPVLELFATLDPLVTKGHVAAARVALANNPKGKVVVFDGMSHWFKDGAKTGTQEENATLGPNIGSPRVVALVSDWLREAFVRPSAAPRAAR